MSKEESKQTKQSVPDQIAALQRATRIALGFEVAPKVGSPERQALSDSIGGPPGVDAPAVPVGTEPKAD